METQDFNNSLKNILSLSELKDNTTCLKAMKELVEMIELEDEKQASIIQELSSMLEMDKATSKAWIEKKIKELIDSKTL